MSSIEHKNNQPKIIYYFNSISTTNLKIAVTLLMVIGTGIHHWVTNNPPNVAWLTFLGAMAGVDTAHFYSKRHTYKPSNENNSSVVSDQNSDASTDVQELHEKG